MLAVNQVYTELKELADRAGVKKFKTKRVERKYCFDAKKDGVPDQGEVSACSYEWCVVSYNRDVESDCTIGYSLINKMLMTMIVINAQYMKVVYPAASPPFLMPTEQGGTVACGKTFSHAFGSQASPLELFLLKRDLMGPCW